MNSSRSTDEQWIAEGLSQTVERETRGGLAHAELPRSLSDTAGPQQCVEDHQEIQVDICDIHAAYILYTDPGLSK